MTPALKVLLVGVGTALVAGLGLWLLLGVTPLIAAPLALVIGGGMGLMTLPGAAQKLTPLAVEPTTTAGLLDASAANADAMAKQLGRLTSRALWSRSSLDERIGELLAGIRTLAAMPALRARERADGDVQTLYRIATDYLPTLVNLAIENDRMHTSFRGTASRGEVERNVAALDEQSAILGEALEHIESDVVQGVSRDAAQHAAFLAARFEQARTASLLDLSRPAAGLDDAAGGTVPEVPGTATASGASGTHPGTVAPSPSAPRPSRENGASA